MCGYCIESAYFECLANGTTETEDNPLVRVIISQEKNSELNFQGLKPTISRPQQPQHLLNTEVKELNFQVRDNSVLFSAKDTKILMDTSVKLLTDYYQWWLLGIDKVQSDGLQRLEETGILDPIMDTPLEEREEFNRLFPLLYSSLNYLLKEEADHPLIRDIAFTNAECPDFDGLDLWLQRKAFIHYLQQEGIQKTLNQIVEKGNRIELLWYGVMKLNLSGEDVGLIIKVLQDNPMLYGSSSACSPYYIEKIRTYSAGKGGVDSSGKGN